MKKFSELIDKKCKKEKNLSIVNDILKEVYKVDNNYYS